MRLPSLAISFLLAAGVLVAYDPPARVARLNYLDGNVSFLPAGVDTWADATLNYPLTTGDHLYSDIGAHAEMQIGPNTLRLGSQTNFGYLNLNDGSAQIRLTEGALEIRLRRLDDDDSYEIDTPQGAITLLRNGEYRIETDPGRNATMVTVRAGEVAVTSSNGAFPVHPRQTAYFAEGGRPDIRDANPPDAFDDFTSARNRDEDRVPEPVHVPTAMVGYQDLDANGVWRNDNAYGWVWVPRTAPNWAPYRYGHWAWVEPWGWTWIDNASWGFAPFHYGRWVSLGGVWAWVPGTPVRRPVYAPALVVFVGSPGFSAAFGAGGGVAWFPLGPREPFVPAYHVSQVYVQQVNITHVNVTNLNVTNIRYANQGVPGAVTAVSRSTFVSARPVATDARVAGPRELAGAEVIGHPGVSPQPASVLGSGRPAGAVVANPPAALMARPVVTKMPPPAAPVSFAARQQAIQANGGRPLEPAQVQQIRAAQPAAAAPVNRMDSRPAGAPRPAVPAAPPTPASPAPAPVNRPASENRPAAGTPATGAPASEKKASPNKNRDGKKRDEKKEEKKP